MKRRRRILGLWKILRMHDVMPAHGHLARWWRCAGMLGVVAVGKFSRKVVAAGIGSTGGVARVIPWRDRWCHGSWCVATDRVWAIGGPNVKRNYPSVLPSARNNGKPDGAANHYKSSRRNGPLTPRWGGNLI